MPWVYLLAAGVCEIVWAIAMKYSQGMTKIVPTILVYGFGLTSFYLLSMAVQHIPIGTGYAVWTGIGAIGAAAAGMILFGEPTHWLRLVSVAVVLIGIVGLRLSWHG